MEGGEAPLRPYNHLKSRAAGPCFFLQEGFGGAPGGDKEGPPTSLERGKELRRTGPSEDPRQVLPSAASRLPRSSRPPSSELRHPPRYLLGCRRSPKQQQQQRTRARPSSQPPHRSRLAERAASRDSLGSRAPAPHRPRALVRQRDRIGRPGRGAKEAQEVGGEETEAARGAARRRRTTTTTPLLPRAEKKPPWDARLSCPSYGASLGSNASSATIPSRFSKEKKSRRGSIAVTRARPGGGGGRGVGGTRRSRFAAFARRPFPTSASLQAQRAPSGWRVRGKWTCRRRPAPRPGLAGKHVCSRVGRRRSGRLGDGEESENVPGRREVRLCPGSRPTKPQHPLFSRTGGDK